MYILLSLVAIVKLIYYISLIYFLLKNLNFFFVFVLQLLLRTLVYAKLSFYVKLITLIF